MFNNIFEALRNRNGLVTVPPNPFDVERNAVKPVSYADIVPDYVGKMTGSEGAALAASFATPSFNFGKVGNVASMATERVVKALRDKNLRGTAGTLAKELNIQRADGFPVGSRRDGQQPGSRYFDARDIDGNRSKEYIDYKSGNLIDQNLLQSTDPRDINAVKVLKESRKMPLEETYIRKDKNGNITGSLSAYIKERTKGKSLKITDIATQNRGEGKDFMRLAHGIAKERGSTKVILNASPGAMKAYEKYGFTTAGKPNLDEFGEIHAVPMKVDMETLVKMLRDNK